MTQKEIVLDIVKSNGNIRSEQVKIKAMYQGVSCADRFLRFLQEDGIIESYKCAKDKTKTWRIKECSFIEHNQFRFA